MTSPFKMSVVSKFGFEVKNHDFQLKIGRRVDGDQARMGRNNRCMVRPKSKLLSIPINSVRANFEVLPTNNKVVSSIQLQNMGLDLLTWAMITEYDWDND